jgi:hypothetical protein
MQKTFLVIHQQAMFFFSDITPVGTQKGCYYYLFDFKTTYIYAL